MGGSLSTIKNSDFFGNIMHFIYFMQGRANSRVRPQKSNMFSVFFIFVYCKQSEFRLLFIRLTLKDSFCFKWNQLPECTLTQKVAQSTIPHFFLTNNGEDNPLLKNFITYWGSRREKLSERAGRHQNSLAFKSLKIQICLLINAWSCTCGHIGITVE